MGDETELARRAGVLVVEHEGARHEISPGRPFTFGRLGDLALDDNPYLHRVLGAFVHRSSLWWLQNVGSRIVIEVADLDSASIFTIKPGAESPVHFAECLVRFYAGRTQYQLQVSVEEAVAEPIVVPASHGAETITLADVPMTVDQRRLVVALAENALRDPYAREVTLPSNRQAALRLGWTLTRFNRKLDNVCQKLAKLGVPGLHGDLGELATDRRRRLVEHAIQSGLVTTADLALLDQPDDGAGGDPDD